jgi:processive 1,2-diacylglycerol beta-glucosyltransferase
MTTKILILTASGGSAHNLTALAFQQIATKQFGDTVVIRIEDIFANSHSFTHQIIQFYNWIHRHAPWFHHIYFNIFEVSALMQWGTQTFVSDYYKNLVLDYQPDLILSVFGSLNRGYFEAAKELLGKQVLCVTLCPEYAGGYGFSVNWVNTNADLFWCHTEAVKQQAIKLGMSPKKIQLSSQLLRENFYQDSLTEQEKKQFLQDKLNLDTHKFTLLLSTNGAGSQNHIDFLKVLLSLAEKLQVIVLCGKNLYTQKKVIQWCQTNPQLKTSVLSFTEKMPQLLQVSQANVQRPGFMMTAESVYWRCPMIFNGMGGIMPQESLAIRYFLPRKMATTITRPQQLFSTIRNWLDFPESYEIICQAHHAYQSYPLTGQEQVQRLIEQVKASQYPLFQ